MADLHGHLPGGVPRCDLLVIAGDICSDYFPQRDWLDRDFRKWLARIPARHVVATWGNHDFAGDAGDVPDLRCRFLVDQTIELDGVRIHGTPWTPVQSRFAFTEDEDVLEGIFSRIPSDVDILISHGPPYGWVDMSRYGTHDGSTALLAAIQRARPALTICGHVHAARGGATAPWGRIENVTAVDERRQLRRPAFLEIKWTRRKRPPEIVVLSASDAAAYEPSGREVCISITDPNADAARLSAKFAGVLRLSFTDIAAPSPFSFDRLFAAEQARAIVDFVRRWPDIERIVVHCIAGRSRSPAVALGISDLHGWPISTLEEQFPLWNTWVRDELVRVGRARNRKGGQ
jgi:hypothetical protein